MEEFGFIILCFLVEDMLEFLMIDILVDMGSSI